jgi:hypothetical protein
MDTQTDLADVDKLWSDLLEGVLDAPQRRRVLDQVASDVKAAVERRPSSAALMEALDQVFGERPLAEYMWPAAERALSLAYGPAVAQLISWLIASESQVQQRLNEILPMLDVRSEALLRDILTRHTWNLVSSYLIWKLGTPESWRTINVEPLRPLDGTPYFIVRLSKLNGEKWVFRSDADSMLVLARIILWGLNQLSSEGFTQESVELFLEEARRIVDTLSASPRASKEQGPGSGTDGPTSDETPSSLSDDGVGEQPR